MAGEATGKNAVLSFGGSPYASLTDISMTGAGTEISEEVSTDGTGNALVLKEVGAENWRVSCTIKIPTNAATIPDAFAIDTAGAVLAYPAGDETGALEYGWTTGQVVNHSVTSSTNTFVALAVELTCTGAADIDTK